MAESREQALDRMTDEAQSLGADAVIEIRFTTSMLMGGAAELLERASAFIRGELARSVEMRYIPELRFLTDDSVERAARVHRLLKQLERQRREDPNGHNGSATGHS